jgi:hypothetical protein
VVGERPADGFTGDQDAVVDLSLERLDNTQRCVYSSLMTSVLRDPRVAAALDRMFIGAGRPDEQGDRA